MRVTLVEVVAAALLEALAQSVVEAAAVGYHRLVARLVLECRTLLAQPVLLAARNQKGYLLEQLAQQR